jgi:hypothetical protein
LLNKELDRIEALATIRGAVPVPKNHRPEAFEWAVRFQVKGEQVSKIANGILEQERKIRQAIDDVLSWVRLDKRRDASGRPPKSPR